MALLWLLVSPNKSRGATSGRLSKTAPKLRSGFTTAMLRLSFSISPSAGEKRKEIWKRSISLITTASVISKGPTRLLMRKCIRRQIKNQESQSLAPVAWSCHTDAQWQGTQSCFGMDSNWKEENRPVKNNLAENNDERAGGVRSNTGKNAGQQWQDRFHWRRFIAAACLRRDKEVE